MSTPVISVVVPVLDEEDNLPELHDRVAAALAEIPYELVVVDDGSTDRSVEIIEAWLARGEDVVLVKLRRNFGMEVAMSAGLDHARGDYVVLMHSDLQDPPELVPEMLAKARAGADVVYARRIGRDESLIKRQLATGFYTLMERLARTPYQGQAGDFRLMSRRVVDSCAQMPERRRFLRGMVAWVGFDQVPIEYRRAGRHAGRGASYRALFRLAIEALASFSDVPLALATVGGHRRSRCCRAWPRVVIARARRSSAGSARACGVWTLVVLLFLGGVQLDQRGDPGALPGSGARADAGPAAVRGRPGRRFFSRISGRSSAR